MATTTPNFGWPVPTSTDLVKDGAVAIEALGDAVDASLLDLKGGTTGQVLSKASNTDMDFTWVTDAAGDITGVTAGVGISGGGTSGTVTITNDMATTITASGDIVVGTGSGTYDNLPIGTTGQILTADTTVSPYKVKWATPATSASGLTYITGASFSAVSSVSLPTDTFSTTYENYKIYFNLTASSAAATETRFRMRAAGSDNTSSSYNSGGYEVNFAGGAANSSTNGGTFVLWGNIADSTSGYTKFEITMMSPKSSTITAFNVNGGKGTATWKAMTGFFNGTTSFDSLSFYTDAGTITGSYRVYGIANS